VFYLVRKWKNINFPEGMFNSIKEFIDEPVVKKNYGFGTVAEFIRSAAREYIENIKLKHDIVNKSKKMEIITLNK